MRKITIIFILFCIVFVSCSQRQIPFNKKQWMREKNRFYMTDSLIKKLNEIFDLLGKPKLEGRISDNEVSYWLKSDGFLAMWELYIGFDDNGNFKSAVVAYAD